jgi:uncharacterized damage-inducible protein DinB
MRNHFYRLYQFNHWANKKLAEALMEDYCEEGAKLLSHVVNAELIWYGRINNESQHPIKLWQLHEPFLLKVYAIESSLNFFQLIDSCPEDDFYRMVCYMNTKGEAFETSLSDILLHVINHGSYHRGQVNKALRSAGKNPVNVDFITFSRSEKKKFN